jgi:hypothetical protein
MINSRKNIGIWLVGILLASVPVAAGEKTVMHCFAWTAVPEATSADWEAFYKASDELPRKISGIVRVWYGPLESRLGQFGIVKMDPAAFKKLQGDAGEPVTGEIHRIWRQYGMCMEMKSADALKAYDTDPYHQVWTEAYSKVRVEGTTTFNILPGGLR